MRNIEQLCAGSNDIRFEICCDLSLYIFFMECPQNISKRKLIEKEGKSGTIWQECTNIIGACQNFISSVLLGSDMRPAGGDLMKLFVLKIHFIKVDFYQKLQI